MDYRKECDRTRSPACQIGLRGATPGLFILFLLVSATGFAEAAETLDIRSLSLSPGPDHAGGRSGGRVSFVADLPTQVLPVDYSFEEDGASVTVGGITVLEFPPEGDRATIRQRSEWVHEYRARGAPPRAGGRLRLDRAHGRIEVKASGLDFSTLAAAGPAGLTVEVRLGGVLFSGTDDCTVRGRTWVILAPPKIIIVPRDRPLPPPGPPVPTLRILLAGAYSAIHAEETAVVRDWPSYGALWARHSPPMPPGVGAPDIGPPDVDFGKEIVVAVFLGDRMNGETAEFTGVAAEGDGLRVAWSEVLLGPTCPVPMYVTIPSHFVFAAISKTAGAVAFTKSVTTRNCP